MNGEVIYIPLEYLKGCVFSFFSNSNNWEITDAKVRNIDTLHWIVKENPFEKLKFHLKQERGKRKMIFVHYSLCDKCKNNNQGCVIGYHIWRPDNYAGDYCLEADAKRKCDLFWDENERDE